MDEECSINKRPRRILITRLSHIGDCILTLPMLNALRQSIPNAYIAWAVESPSQQLLSLHPGIDEIILVPRGWMKRSKLWLSLRKELRKRCFDIAIDPQGITKSAMLGRLSGAKQRIGARGRWGRELSTLLNNELIEPKSEHVVDRSLELLNPLNIQSREPRFDLPVCPSSLARMTDFVQSNHSLNRFAVINPGASWPSKRWKTDRFAGVAQYLSDRHSLKSVITWAGDEELEMSERIVSLAPSATIAAPATNLRELAALCQLSEFFVGCDTGPLHIASAMGIPCIGLYGTTRPEESGAYGSQHRAVQKWYQSGTSRQRRGAENEAMLDIQIEDVCHAIDNLLKNLCRSSMRKSG